MRPSICVQGGKSCAACRVRCPIAAAHALGPTDGEDGPGRGLLHHSTRAAAPWEPLGGRGEQLAPRRCCRWTSHHFGTRVWASKAQNLSVGTPSHVWQSFASPSLPLPPSGLRAPYWEASSEASRDGGMLFALPSERVRLAASLNRSCLAVEEQQPAHVGAFATCQYELSSRRTATGLPPPPPSPAPPPWVAANGTRDSHRDPSKAHGLRRWTRRSPTPQGRSPRMIGQGLPVVSLPQSHLGPGAHRPRATRRLASERTPKYDDDTGAVAAAASLHPRATSPGAGGPRNAQRLQPCGLGASHAQLGSGAWPRGRGSGWPQAPGLSAVGAVGAPATARWAPNLRCSKSRPTQRAADAPPVAVLLMLPALEWQGFGARGIGALGSLLCAPWSGRVQGDALTHAVPSTEHLAQAPAVERRKSATAMRGGSTTPLPTLEMHIKGLCL
ncbi:hypothetical protein TARUN_2259 [Trichoderma arundinaceum]|uniref:Uncharacterized protein n=1 Tax=Trichoderma arundinaceum TaxID=490622 RepID=A0A395NVY1_TRIAR|nr:hypothetical protein TARUN_2259 [Trichoderma arundinaceum]